MEKKQELEWSQWIEAQKIVISEDLLGAAKQQLKFLAAVDRNRYLYNGPALDNAIYRYKNFWLPLLAKHAESQFSEGPLVVPLDSEWIWHCHRLNPVRYMTDCKVLFGGILDNKNVVSSVHGTSKKHTEEIWNKMYPNEPYELNPSGCFGIVAESKVGASETTKYDLVSAVKRQSTFYYQVARSHMSDDLFLEVAIARYKGFLHLIKRNKERNIECFCVPTYDIDLIWHSHQLHPSSYSKDLVGIIGKVLDHNDMDSDRTEGEKLDAGFHETTKQWEETYGLRYWRAGAMYRGSPPFPLSVNVTPPNIFRAKGFPPTERQDMIRLPEKMIVEVMVEISGVKYLPAGHKGNLFAFISKKQPDLIFKTRRKLSIFSKPMEKQVATFQCETTGDFLLELVSNSPSKILGTTLISLKDLLNPVSKWSLENWIQLSPPPDFVGTEQISLRISLSLTPPFPAPYLMHMVSPHPFSRNTPFFPLPDRVQHAQSQSWTCIVDESGNEIISIQMRDTKISEERKGYISKKEVIGMTRSCEIRALAECVGEEWSLMGSQRFFQLQKILCEEDHVFELTGNRKVIIFRGRKLGYEIKNCERQRNERDFMTIIEFSTENPYGKAVALLNLKSGFLMVEEQWLVLPGITLAFIFSHILKKEGLCYFSTKRENLKETNDVIGKDVDSCNEKYERNSPNTALESDFFNGWNGGGACGGCGGGGSCGGSCGGGGGGCRSDGGSQV